MAESFPVVVDLDGFSLQELEGRGNLPGWLETWLESPEKLMAGRGRRAAIPWDLA